MLVAASCTPEAAKDKDTRSDPTTPGTATDSTSGTTGGATGETEGGTTGETTGSTEGGTTGETEGGTTGGTTSDTVQTGQVALGFALYSPSVFTP